MLPQRKPTRLANYDYRQNGYYFVTICTHNRKNVLSRIVGQGLAPAENELLPYGKIVEKELLAIEKRYAGVRMDKYVIMPNHIHAILVIDTYAAGASPCPTLSQVVGTVKSIATRKCKKVYPMDKIFQTSFHDHIIRNKHDYQEIWKYIDNNPAKWTEDRFYSNE